MNPLSILTIFLCAMIFFSAIIVMTEQLVIMTYAKKSHHKETSTTILQQQLPLNLTSLNEDSRSCVQQMNEAFHNITTPAEATWTATHQCARYTIPTVNAQNNNDTAQFIQLKKYAAMFGTRGLELASMLGMNLNTVDDLKQWLSTQVAVHEGYTNDPNPANYAADNQTMANLDIQITNYLYKIDQTYCANGPNAPVRILKNAG
jgi:hypothetical protein